LIVLAAARNVEQAEQYSFRTNAQTIVEIAGDSFSVSGGGNLSAIDLGEIAGDGLQQW
jgi:hypothetical protein